jgi:hypothetical protein
MISHTLLCIKQALDFGFITVKEEYLEYVFFIVCAGGSDLGAVGRQQYFV